MRTLLLVAGLLAAGAGSGCAAGRFLGDRAHDLADCVRIEGGWGPGLGVQVRAAGVVDSGLALACTPRRLGFAWKYGRAHAMGAGYGETGQGWDGEVDGSAVVQGLVALDLWASWATFDALYEPGAASNEAAGYASAAVALPAIAAIVGMGGERGRNARPNVVTTWHVDASPHASLDPRHATRAFGFLLPAVFTWVRPDPEQHGRRSGHGGDWLWSHAAARRNVRAHVHAFDIEASVWAGFAYARVGVSPGELWDFLAGWAGADPAGDDRLVPSG